MFTATNLDGPAFNTRSKTSHHHQTTTDTEPSNTQPIKETVTLDLTTVETAQDITLKPLTADMKPYCRCRRWIHFVNTSPNGYQMARHQSIRPIYSHVKGLLYTPIMDTNQKFMALIIPKVGSIQYQ